MRRARSGRRRYGAPSTMAGTVASEAQRLLEHCAGASSQEPRERVPRGPWHGRSVLWQPQRREFRQSRRTVRGRPLLRVLFMRCPRIRAHRLVAGQSRWHAGGEWDCGGIAYYDVHAFGWLVSVSMQRYEIRPQTVGERGVW